MRCKIFIKGLDSHPSVKVIARQDVLLTFLGDYLKTKPKSLYVFVFILIFTAETQSKFNKVYHD